MPPDVPLEAYSDADIPRTRADTRPAPETQPAPVSARLVGIYDQQDTGPKPTAASMGVIAFKASEKPVKARDWLWQGKIACGVVTGLSGDPGLGKSQIIASLAAIVTTGGQWPVTRDRAPLGSVILLNCEDDFETTMAPRLIAAGANMDKIYVFDGIKTVGQNGESSRLFDLGRDIQRLVTLMDEIGDVRLVSIDPISAYVGKIDSHNNTDVRGALAPLTRAAEANHETGKPGAAILLVNHLNKDSSKSALHRTQGSVAWTAAPRCIWAVTRDKDDETGRLRIMGCVKNNIGPDTDGFRYEVEGMHLTDSDPLIETSRIMWHAEAVPNNAVELFTQYESKEEKSAHNDASQFLADILAHGSVPVKEVKRKANESGISEITLKRAKFKMGIIYRREGGVGGTWIWALPEPKAGRGSYGDRDG